MAAAVVVAVVVVVLLMMDVGRATTLERDAGTLTGGERGSCALFCCGDTGVNMVGRPGLRDGGGGGNGCGVIAGCGVSDGWGMHGTGVGAGVRTGVVAGGGGVVWLLLCGETLPSCCPGASNRGTFF